MALLGRAPCDTTSSHTALARNPINSALGRAPRRKKGRVGVPVPRDLTECRRVVGRWEVSMLLRGQPQGRRAFEFSFEMM